MSILGWLRGKRRGDDRERDAWRRSWSAAVEANDVSVIATLRDALQPLQRPDEDIEVEVEMLDALEQLAAIHPPHDLPVIETQHRVVAGETCHFTAPASLPDDPNQASGRVLFTAARSIFVGGGSKTQPLPWHAVKDVVRSERDLLLLRPDGSASAHFRFNNYGDAVVAAYLARRLKGSKGTRVL